MLSRSTKIVRILEEWNMYTRTGLRRVLAPVRGTTTPLPLRLHAVADLVKDVLGQVTFCHRVVLQACADSMLTLFLKEP